MQALEPCFSKSRGEDLTPEFEPDEEAQGAGLKLADTFLMSLIRKPSQAPEDPIPPQRDLKLDPFQQYRKLYEDVVNIIIGFCGDKFPMASRNPRDNARLATESDLRIASCNLGRLVLSKICMESIRRYLVASCSGPKCCVYLTRAPGY